MKERKQNLGTTGRSLHSTETLRRMGCNAFFTWRATGASNLCPDWTNSALPRPYFAKPATSVRSASPPMPSGNILHQRKNAKTKPFLFQCEVNDPKTWKMKMEMKMKIRMNEIKRNANGGDCVWRYVTLSCAHFFSCNEELRSYYLPLHQSLIKIY
jgi:hypothetical protein